MGIFNTIIKATSTSDIRLERAENVDTVVDTGSTFTTIGRETLQRIGVQKIGTTEVTLANGNRVLKDYGGALLVVEGRPVICTVIFGDPGDLCLLGATTLEQACFGVDPLNKKLVPISAIQA
jgi:predicted aspartyl protease